MSIETNNTPLKTLEELQYFWMPSGLPCFIASDNNICDVVESLGFNIYYLFANETVVKNVPYSAPVRTPYTYVAPEPPTVSISYFSSLFKVVNNFVGRVIEKSTDELPSTFLSIEPICEYTMPAIPHILLDKMDQFFRLVYTQHGTESIVLLTYDMNQTGSNGWGVLVPEQTNTSAHCKYDADSIAEIKPNDVMIVGSVHSHPEMSAYASGTDHDDQSDFDGLHITYGWQKSVSNGATQYHIELQMSGTAYKLLPQDVFEDLYINKDPDPQVIEWSTKVKKVHPPFMGGPLSLTTQPILTTEEFHRKQNPLTVPQENGIHTPTSIHMAGGATTGSGLHIAVNIWHNMLMTLEKEAIIISEVSLPQACPCCDYDLQNQDILDCACATCDTLIVLESDSMKELTQKLHRFCSDRFLDITKVVPYLYGTNNLDEIHLIKMNPYLTKDLDIYEQDSDHLTLLKLKDDEDDSVYNDNADVTLCCGVPTGEATLSCFCIPQIFPENLMAFEEAVAEIDLYDPNSICSDCVSYYQITCPSFKNLLIDWMNSYNYDLKNSEYTISTCNQYSSLYSSVYDIRK